MPAGQQKDQPQPAHQPWADHLIAAARKRIEVAFSDIAKCFAKTIHAVTSSGFLIKLIAFVWPLRLKNWIKNGVLKGVQRYKRKDCGCNYTVAFRRGTKPMDLKRQALLMYRYRRLDRPDSVIDNVIVIHI